MIRTMMPRLVLASLRRRLRQLGLILAAVAVAAATVSTLGAFAGRVHRSLGRDLEAFGPNLTVRPQVGGPPRIPAAEAARVRGVPGVLWVRGVRGPGGAEPSGFARLDVRVAPDRLKAAAGAIEARLAGVEARPLLRVSEADARVTRRVLSLLAAVSGVSLLLALLSVAAATAALVGERRTEIGLLLALGCTVRRIGGLLAAEILAAACAAALAGDLLGELAARDLARRLLGPVAAASAPLVSWAGLSGAVLAAVSIVGLSMAFALTRIGRLDAATVLKGD
ncbi:MAG TPA: FtsX-like permease family protein [Thermoanaerobaculia bacterium]|nr:FtsX-like permease family protein [Thermoanaerobaculia bacterium]